MKVKGTEYAAVKTQHAKWASNDNLSAAGVCNEKCNLLASKNTQPQQSGKGCSDTLAMDEMRLQDLGYLEHAPLKCVSHLLLPLLSEGLQYTMQRKSHIIV